MNLLNRSFSHIYIEKEAKQYEEYVRTLINLHMELIPYLYK